MDGVKISTADAISVASAMETLRVQGWIEGAADDVRMEMHIVLWRHCLGEASDEVRRAIALLAGQCYVRDQRRVAPTAPLAPEPKPPKQTTSWWGMLTATEDED